MATDGGQPEGMRLVQVGINPLLVKLVGSAVFGKRVHVACRLLKALQDFCRIINEQELVIDMVTGEHQPHRSGKTQTAVAAVGGVFLITGIRLDGTGKIIHIGKRMYAEDIIPDAHLRRAHLYILQCGRVLLRKRKILFNQSGLLRCTDNLIGAQPFQTDKGRVIQDALELVDTLQKQADRFFVPDFLRNYIPPAEDGEIALAAAAFLSRLGDKQVREMI